MYGARSIKMDEYFPISFCKMIVYMVLFYVAESFFKLDYCSIKYISSYINISYFTKYKFEINLAGPALT